MMNNYDSMEQLEFRMAKTVLITGANRGIGLGFVESYLKSGDNVIATARNPNSAKDLKRLKAQYRDQLEIFALDLDSPEAESQLVKIVKKPEKLDILINNAGFYPNSYTEKFDKVNLTQWETAFRINVLGAARTLRKAIPRLQKSDRPIVVNISTQMSSIAQNQGGSIGYRVTKSALNMFNSCIALEYKDIISVLLNPGWVKTRMGGLNAEISVEDSVADMRKIIDKLKDRDSGKFFDHSGREIPW